MKLTARPHRASRFLLVLLMFSGAALLGAGAAHAAPGDSNVTWTVRTAANKYGDARTRFSYNISPGGKITDAMVVANHGKTALDLGVYAADGYTTGSGQFDLLTKERKSVGVGAWAHLASRVSIQPGKTATVPFTIDVPASATPGDYSGGVVTSLTRADGAQQINVDRRLGIRLDLRVGGTVTPRLAVEHVHVDYAGTGNPFGNGDATISYTLHNTGNAALSATQSVSVSGPFGWFKAAAAGAATPPQLLPDEHWTVTVPVHGLTPSLRLNAKVTVTPVLTDAAGSTTSLRPVFGTAHGWAVPWTFLALIAVIVALIVGGLVLLRRRRSHRKAREDERVQQAVEDALSAHGGGDLT